MGADSQLSVTWQAGENPGFSVSTETVTPVQIQTPSGFLYLHLPATPGDLVTALKSATTTNTAKPHKHSVPLFPLLY